MPNGLSVAITGTGKYIPEVEVGNDYFLNTQFYNPDGTEIDKSMPETMDTFKEITRISSRRYALPGVTASEMGEASAVDCFNSSGKDPSGVECLVVAHNFGDCKELGTDWDVVPSIAARVKNYLKIQNPKAVAYDVIASRQNSGKLLGVLASGRNNLILERREGIPLEDFYSQAERVIESRGTNKESLENIVVIHDSSRTPSLAEKIGSRVGIPETALSYDILFGCPGWLQGTIQATSLIKSGLIKNALTIGTENLPLIADVHDRDSPLYAAGAGSAFIEKAKTDFPAGFLSHAVMSDTLKEAYLLRMEKSYNPEFARENPRLFLHMDGHDLFRYALRNVPETVRESLETAGLSLSHVKKILLHQANEKLDEGIVNRVFNLYGIKATDEQIREIMPMIISWLGNSSVATVPILFNLMVRGEVNNHNLSRGDYIVLGSVGAGMNRNATVYRMSGLEDLRMAD
jgi:3-oxoacyl-[acyl-carrier-protein] synthase-3